MKRLPILLMVALCMAEPSHAEVYKCVIDGKVQYKSKLEDGCASVELKDTLSPPQELERQRLERERRAAEEKRKAEEEAKLAPQREMERLQRAQLEFQRRQMMAQREAAKPIWIPPTTDDPFGDYKAPKGFRTLPIPLVIDRK